MVAAGITAELLTERIGTGLDAIDDSLMPDHARQKYIKLAVKLLGLKPGKQIEEGATYEEQVLRGRGIKRQ